MGNSKTYKIAMAKPCTEAWDKMQFASDGRFCESCHKTVVDFTSKTDDEIISFLSKNPTGCGRFYKNQIETIQFEFETDILNSNIANWKKFLIVLLVCFGYELFHINFTIAQTKAADSNTIANKNVTINDSLLIDTVMEQALDSTRLIVPTSIQRPIQITEIVSGIYYPYPMDGFNCDIWKNQISNRIVYKPLIVKTIEGDSGVVNNKVTEYTNDTSGKDQIANAYIANKTAEESPKPKEESNRPNEYIASKSLSHKPRRRRFKTPNKKPNQPSE